MMELEIIKDMNMVASGEDEIDALVNSLQASVECLVPSGHFERVELVATIDKTMIGRIARLVNVQLKAISDRHGVTYSIDFYHNDARVRLLHRHLV